jgi:hypothetical protein
MGSRPLISSDKFYGDLAGCLLRCMSRQFRHRNNFDSYLRSGDHVMSFVLTSPNMSFPR